MWGDNAKPKSPRQGESRVAFGYPSCLRDDPEGDDWLIWNPGTPLL